MNVTVSQTLSRTFNIDVSKSETVEEAFKRQYWDPASLIKEFDKWLTVRLSHGLDNTAVPSARKVECQLLSCKNWTVDDFAIIPE